MPMYFKQSKYTSFTRKLNRWGFTRVTTGAEQGAYYHKVSYIAESYVVMLCSLSMKILVSNPLLCTSSQNKIMFKSFQRGNHLLCMQMQCQSSTPLKSDQNLHEQNKLLHEEKIAAQQQKMGGRATYDTNEGNRLSLLAQEDAAANGIPTMIPPKPVAIHLPNSQKRVPATSNVDLDEAIRRQKAMLAADEAQLLGNTLDTQQHDLSRQRALLRGSMGSVGSGFDPILEKQHQLLRSTLEESERNEAEAALLYKRTRQQTQQILSSMPWYVPPPNNYPNDNVMPSSMSMNMMAANNGYNQYDKKDKNRQKHAAIMEENIPEVSLDDLPKEALDTAKNMIAEELKIIIQEKGGGGQPH